ncbi:hypothetical protein [Spirochaeta cellobiosiphila]|uniref:hypothetical protein n=1 Tax=Spirochaeta cellobiosiphila TaxID=504483 RepID=UPI000424D01D|nr:hypothetical protein [Spirochaeta cellobiosiphila]
MGDDSSTDQLRLIELRSWKDLVECLGAYIKLIRLKKNNSFIKTDNFYKGCDAIQKAIDLGFEIFKGRLKVVEPNIVDEIVSRIRIFDEELYDKINEYIFSPEKETSLKKIIESCT